MGQKEEVDISVRGDVPSEVAAQLKALEREDRELRQANETCAKHWRNLLRRKLDPSACFTTMLRIGGTLRLFKR